MQDRWDSKKIIYCKKGYWALELWQKSSPNYLSELKLLMMADIFVFMLSASLDFYSISKKVSLTGTKSAKSISNAP